MCRLVCTLALCAAALLSSARADLSIPVVRRDNPAVVSAKLHRGAPISALSSTLQARDSNSRSPIPGPAVLDEGYWVNVSLGTPPQSLAMLLDVTDPDFSVVHPGSGETNCSSNRYCARYGYFEPKNSSSFYSPAGEHKKPTQYYRGFDTAAVGGVQAANVSLGLIPIEVTYDAFNILGVSPGNSSFPYRLVDHCLINSPSFSIWNDPDGTGEAGIILGGTNTAKYHGPLQAFSFQDTPGVVSFPTRALQIQLGNETSPGNSTRSYNFPEKPFILHTRYTRTSIPCETAMQMYTDFNISYSGGEGWDYFPQVDCFRRNENHTISLEIGNATLSAPWDDFILESGSPGLCFFLIFPWKGNKDYDGEIGSPFSLRTYLTVDYNTMLVGIAPLNHNPGPDNVLEIGLGPTLPDAVGDFPANYTPYTPAPTVTPSTSTGEAPARTAFPGNQPANLIPGVAGAPFNRWATVEMAVYRTVDSKRPVNRPFKPTITTLRRLFSGADQVST